MKGAPAWIPPMLATLTAEAPDGPGWVYERKLDGIRTFAYSDGKSVRLLSRNKLLLDFDDVVRALEPAGNAFVLDGEVVAFADGRTSFEILQQRGKRTVKIRYYVFDLLHWAGEDVRALRLLERKARLAKVVRSNGVVKLSRHRKGDGHALHDAACEQGWEGLIAKRADAPYRAGRSRDWLKLKCSLEQEFVIGGFTDPKGSRTGFGALLIGYREDGGYRFAGEVGTGFTVLTLETLGKKLRALETETSPFEDVRRRPKDVHFVKPKLVCQVAFGEWTRDGKLRHPRFLGLRTDKAARDVVRERPA